MDELTHADLWALEERAILEKVEAENEARRI